MKDLNGSWSYNFNHKTSQALLVGCNSPSLAVWNPLKLFKTLLKIKVANSCQLQRPPCLRVTPTTKYLLDTIDFKLPSINPIRSGSSQKLFLLAAWINLESASVTRGNFRCDQSNDCQQGPYVGTLSSDCMKIIVGPTGNHTVTLQLGECHFDFA